MLIIDEAWDALLKDRDCYAAFRKALTYIAQDGYDTTGFELTEIPIQGKYTVFSFTSHEKKFAFDIEVSEDSYRALCPSFTEKPPKRKGSAFPASNIADVVAKYEGKD